jgi:hypothetical protein
MSCPGADVLVALAATTLGPEPQPSAGRHRISLADPPAAFPADTAFFVRHGFVDPAPERGTSLNPRTEFSLSVDGTLVPLALDSPSLPSRPSERWSIARFRWGLPPGPHTFAGHWYAEGALVLSIEATIEFVASGS